MLRVAVRMSSSLIFVHNSKEQLKKVREVLGEEKNHLILDQCSSKQPSKNYLSWQKVFACSHGFLQNVIETGRILNEVLFSRFN
jgi:hypothetical protein